MIEPVNVEDLAEVETLIIDCIVRSVDASADEKEAFIANVRKNLRRWSEEPVASAHLTYLENGRLTGVVLILHFWNLCHLFVAPEAQGRGIGKQLIEATIAQCSDRCPAPAIQLNASRNAVSFYEARGFLVLEPASDKTFGATPMHFLMSH
jgi:GNAT superfamily N-acetyltransferase